MSTELKNTLFRFVTMRAPELLTENDSADFFVRHPESQKLPEEEFTSTFFSALYSDSEFDRKTRINNAVNSIDEEDSIYDKEMLRTKVSNGFFEFAHWLGRNRDKLKLSELQFRALATSPLTNDKLIKLWDNFLSKLFTQEDPYLREAIVSALIADHFLRHFDPVNDTLERARQLAKARVIVPKYVVEVEEVLKDTKDILFNVQKVKDSIQSSMLLDEIEQLEYWQKGMTQIDRVFKKMDAHQYEEARKDYDTAVKTAYANATKTTQTYKDGNNIDKTYIEYTDLNLPDFEYTPLTPNAILGDPDNNNVQIGITELFQELGGSEFLTTFEEARDFLAESARVQKVKLMQRVNQPEKVISVGGSIIPATALSRPAMLYSITKIGVPMMGVRLILGMKELPQGTNIVAANYTVSFDDGTTIQETSYNDYWSGNELKVELLNTPDNYFNPSDGQNSFILNGFLTCSDGTKIYLNNGQASIFTLNGNGPGSGNTNNVGRAFLQEIAGPGSEVHNRMGIYGVIGGGNYIIKPEIQFEFEEPAIPGDDTPGGNTTTPSNGNVLENVVSKFGITSLGIADYRRVEQEICCYVPGEVSHIENVMAREYKEKSSRSLRRSEITETKSSERESEKLTDTTTADRFEMNQEAQSVISEQTSIGTHAFFDGHYTTGSAGMSYNFGASADFAHNVSEEVSNSQAITQAKEVTERALDRVVSKVRTERTSKMIEEYEENNKHGFDNRKGDRHVSGVFRWVDKIYRNRIVNYGKRLMYEFMIPEPAAFHKMMTNSALPASTAVTLVKPVDPRTAQSYGMETYEDVTDDNYNYWAALYNADVQPKPKATIQVGASFAVGYSEANGYKIGTSEVSAGAGKVEIPEGYVGTSGSGTFSAAGEGANGKGRLISLSIGGKNIIKNSGTISGDNFSASSPAQFTAYHKEVPVSYTLGQHTGGDVSVTITCILTAEAEKQWKIETFSSIIEAYDEKLKEYEEKLAQTQQAATEKIALNPGFYRQIENMSLRKNCLDYLVSSAAIGQYDLIADRNLSTVHAKYDSQALNQYAAKVKFFEQAFEWELMSYMFYPFYWAHKDQWKKMYLIDNDDPLFRSFLQCGMARIILTVRPGFEDAVNWYMATGQIWNGGQVPTLDDPMYLSIVDELQVTEGTVEGEWESRVPTSLTVIQAGTLGLEVDQALPCDEDCHDFLRFDSDGNETTDSPFVQPVDENGNPAQLGNIVDATSGDVSGTLQEIGESIEELQGSIEELQADVNAIQESLNNV